MYNQGRYKRKNLQISEGCHTEDKIDLLSIAQGAEAESVVKNNTEVSYVLMFGEPS